jgi:hypothetical protein
MSSAPARVVRALPLAVALVAFAGCGQSARQCVPGPIASPNDWIDLSRNEANAPARTHVAFRPDNGAPRNILALSGGGMYGAFGVGVLNGWSDAGTRPTFDVITGVSVGALAGTYLFLGPEYDPQLKRLFTTVSDRDIFRRRGPLAPLRFDSIVSSAPLKRLIDDQISPEILARVAEEHAAGRRLYMGTTNLDTRRLVVWDMGAIAARGDLCLYRNIVLASASIPGFFPPVRIEIEVNGRTYVEMHIDGGASAQVFVHRSMLDVDEAEGPRRAKVCRPTTIWVVAQGKLYADPACSGGRALEIGLGATTSLIYAQTRNDIRRIATLASCTGAEFRMIALPQDFPVGKTEQLFDATTMSKLFDIGYTLGKSGPKAWRSTMPELDDDEQPAPRTGTRFAAPEPVRSAGQP